MSTSYIIFLLICSLVFTVLLRKHVAAYGSLAMVCLALGCGAAAAKTWWIERHYTPLKTEWVGRITATITDIEQMDGQWRLVLDNITGQDLNLHRARVNFKYKKDTPLPDQLPYLQPGTPIRAYVKLSPIPPQETPLNYDFQFWSFFQGIEAIGYGGASSIKVQQHQSSAGFFERLRYTITQGIRSADLGQRGEIAIALITGYRNGIDTKIRDDFAGSGIAHILAISGLHLSLIAGLMFLVFRRGLSRSAYLALHWPLKKIAAVFALACSFFYLEISGEAIPTIRAFIMVSLLMLGVVFDRDPISLRSVAWAALVILTIKPESMYSPSFQMSFAAVTGLIGCYEYFKDRTWRFTASPHARWYTTALVYLGGSALSSLIASVATLPFIMHTFHRFSWHSIEANLIAIPLMSFWIMPLAVCMLLLMPLGLQGWALIPMGWGIEVLLWLANTINNWPGSFVPVGVRHSLCLPLILTGAFWWLCWTHRWRWAGIPLIIGAFLLPKQDVFMLISADQKRIGIMANNNVLLTQTGRPNFVSQDWKGIVGVSTIEKLTKSNAATPTPWGYRIHPFASQPFSIAIVTVDHPPQLSDPIIVTGFPTIDHITVNGKTLTLGAALCLDANGNIQILGNDPPRAFPWR